VKPEKAFSISKPNIRSEAATAVAARVRQIATRLATNFIDKGPLWRRRSAVFWVGPMLWFLFLDAVPTPAGGAGGDPMPKPSAKTSAKT
jgi:hypothetical protein